MMARARGSGSRLLKRTSHIRIVLSDEIPIETRETRKAKREQEKKAKKQATSGASESSTPGAGKKPAKSKKTARTKK
jgi:protein subunit release factor B